MIVQQKLSPLCNALVACGVLSIGAPVFAQELPPATQDAGLQVVTVTAQKRSQSIKEVPVAMSVVSGEQLERQGVRDIQDLSKTTASLEFADTKSNGAGGSASIRGVGTSVFTSSAESSVGLVVDGVPLGNTAGSALFDLERVEVLRGPQGMLFGKNASAGVLNMVTKAPVIGRYEGSLSAEYSGLDKLGSNIGNKVLRGAFNVPLNDISALRITAHVDQQDGIFHNVLTGQDGKNQGDGARVRYLLKPDADLSINLIAEHDDLRSSGPFFFAPAVGTPATVAAYAACGVTVSPRNTDVCSDREDRRRIQTSGFSGQVDKTLANGLTLTSITAWRQRDEGPTDTIVDMGNFGTRVRSLALAGQNRLFSQELRLASPNKQAVEWTAGAFYSKYHAWQDKPTYFTPDMAAVLHDPMSTPTAIKAQFNTVTELESAALFGQTQFKLDEQWSAIAGMRYSRERVNDVQTNITDASFLAFTAPTATNVSSGNASERNFSGRIGLKYALDKQTNMYATLTRGYKGPQIDNGSGLNALGPSDTGAHLTGTIVRPEIATNLEAGVKSSLFNRRLDVDLALFHTKIRDFQEQSCVMDPSRALLCTPLNISEVTNYGVEADLRVRPLPGLMLGLGGALVLGSEYPDGFVYDSKNLGGQRLMYSPKQKVTATAEYVVGELGDWEWHVGGDLAYKSRVRYCNSLSPSCAYGGHTMIGLRTGVRSADDKWGFTLFGRNLSDKRVPSAITYPLAGKPNDSGFANTYTGYSFRSIGVQMDYRF